MAYLFKKKVTQIFSCNFKVITLLVTWKKQSDYKTHVACNALPQTPFNSVILLIKKYGARFTKQRKLPQDRNPIKVQMGVEKFWGWFTDNEWIKEHISSQRISIMANVIYQKQCKLATIASSYYHTPPVKMIDWWQVGGTSGIGAGLPVQAGLPV